MITNKMANTVVVKRSAVVSLSILSDVVTYSGVTTQLLLFSIGSPARRQGDKKLVYSLIRVVLLHGNL